MGRTKSEVTVERVEEVQEVPEVQEKESILEQVIYELKTNPSLSVKLVSVLSKITNPWETIGLSGQHVNELAVPQGVSVEDFKKKLNSNPHVSGYRLTTIFGREIAIIVKDHPKYKVTIEGETQADAPFVTHSKKAEDSVKEFAEKRLKEKGYILGGK